MAKQKVTLEQGEVCIKGNKDFVNWLVVSAFRYCVNRHNTQAMYGVGNVILDNLDVIHTGFIKQFISDIESEQRSTKIINECNKERAIDYFAGLKGHIKDSKLLLETEKGDEAKQLLGLLNEVEGLLPQVDLSHRWQEWKLFDNPDTTYLTPMLNRLRNELEERGEAEHWGGSVPAGNERLHNGI